VFGPRCERTSGGPLLEAGRTWFSTSADRETVAAVLTNDAPSVAFLLGALDAGTTVVSLPLPSRSDDPAQYCSFVEQACRQSGAQTVVARDDLAALLAASGLDVRAHSQLGARPVAGPAAAGFHLVQFSSGTTERAKAIRLSDRDLGANVSAIVESVDPQPGDAVVSWLPLSHDMGLIGLLLSPLASLAPSLAGGGVIVILDPVQFLREPGSWLSAVTEFAATVSASPDFGLRLCTARAHAANVDLSTLRHLILGGEQVRASTLREFAEKYGIAGFDARALCPAYGMAEFGLAVTMTEPGELRSNGVDAAALAQRRFEPAFERSEQVPLIASGAPLNGYEIDCGPERAVGPIRARGPSCGYDLLRRSPCAGGDGWFDTGDIGTIDDGALYVLGRSDDYVVMHGRSVYCPSVEQCVGSLSGVRAGRALLVTMPTGDCVVVAESENMNADAAELRRRISSTVVAMTGAQPDGVELTEKGWLPVTASGKLRRRAAVGRLVLERDA
jgi:acyl-CoA synthetase (AMP-forming)/AMP-acid ligase II